MRRARPGLEALEARCVPSIVTYNDTSHLPLANGLLLDEQTVFGSPIYNPNNGALSIRIDSSPTKGTVQVFNSFDFKYTPNQGTTGTDSFTWEVLQNGTSLIGVQEVDLTLSGSQPWPGSSSTQITFQNYSLDYRDVDGALFMPQNGAPIVYPTIGLIVLVQATPPSFPPPTGPVEFTYTPSGGSETSLGVATLGGSSGLVALSVDSSLIAQPGVVVTAKYKGDWKYAAKTASDGGKNATDLRADPPVTDNPVIPPNATNLTVVVVCGSGPERKQWTATARTHYGAGAYIITSVHSVADLGAALSTLPAASITHLVIGSHGWDSGAWLGTQWFNFTEVSNATPAVQNQIKNSLGNNALIDYQSCGAASSPAGLTNMQQLATFFHAQVRGADRCIKAWDDAIATWITKSP